MQISCGEEERKCDYIKRNNNTSYLQTNQNITHANFSGLFGYVAAFFIQTPDKNSLMWRGKCWIKPVTIKNWQRTACIRSNNRDEASTHQNTLQNVSVLFESLNSRGLPIDRSLPRTNPFRKHHEKYWSLRQCSELFLRRGVSSL